MFVPGYGRTYDEGNTDRFPVDGDGFIDFWTIFPYLGSKISSDCTDDADIISIRRVLAGRARFVVSAVKVEAGWCGGAARRAGE